MKFTRVSKFFIVSVLAILLILVAVFYLFLSPREAHHHPLIAIYPTEVSGHDPVHDTDRFLSDLALIRELGFEGVRLHPKDYEDYGYGRVADDLNSLDLEFVMVVECEDFTDAALFNQTIAYFRNVVQQLRSKTNLLWYSVKYPYDWNKSYTQMEDPNYSSELQRMIDAIHESDPDHKIFLVSGMIDTVATPPTDFIHVAGFGIEPYSRKGWVDELDVESIRWIETYRNTGKEVYIAEWGVQTIEESPHRKYDYGLASNESKKVEMIQEFLDYISDWNIYWTYFGLHDYLPEDSDWGIAYYNNTLKPSGETFKELLANKK